jgi:hypothetical protein
VLKDDIKDPEISGADNSYKEESQGQENKDQLGSCTNVNRIHTYSVLVLTTDENII